VIVAGFAVLGTEYAWAAAALERSKGMAQKGGQVATGAVRSVRRKVTGS
jgi:hypothetical protein